MTSPPLPRGAAPPLSLSPLSPVATASVFCRLGGALWATVVVKATFQLVHGEAARLVGPLELVLADQANSNNGSLERARETAPHVPNAGVLLTGHAHAPGGRAVPSMSVRLGISREKPVIDKTLHVSVAGPNPMDPRDPWRVAGFGPVAPHWAPRRALLGGLDPSTVHAAVWEVPERFDWRFFQAAPADQQLDRLHGDEWIVLDGMHPALPRVMSRLPQVAALARRQMTSGAEVTEHPVELRADMLVIDADRLLASVVWRGRFVVPRAEMLAATRMLVGLEMPGKPVTWPAVPAPKVQAYSAETRDIDVSAVLAAAMPFGSERSSAQSPASAEPKPAPMSTGTAVVDLRALLHPKSAVPFAGALPTDVLSVPAEPPRAPGAALASVELTPVSDTPSLPFIAADPSRPTPASLPTPAAHKPTPMSTGTSDIDLEELRKGGWIPGATPAPSLPAPLPPAPLVVDAAPPPVVPPLPSAPLAQPELAPPLPVAPPPLLGSPPAAAPSAAETPPAPEPAPSPPPASGAHHRAAVMAGERLDGQDLAGADLSGLDLSGRSLTRCILRGAVLRGANLAGANLTGVVLDEADLRGANLSGAELREASLVRADLERANLSRCRGEGANLTQANLCAADLRAARLPGARLEKATLQGAEAAGVYLTEACMDGANLEGAGLRRGQMKKASLAGANLDRADLRCADLEGADLRGATHRMAKLAGANMNAAVSDDDSAFQKKSP